MCFQASREEARIHADGSIILLKDQDRSRWNQPLIEKGKYYLENAAEGETFSEYHIEAAIAGCHARAKSFSETDWSQIHQLYSILLATIRPGPIVELNKAIAIGYADSPGAGLAALQDIHDLQHHYLYHSAIGDFHVELGNSEQARRSYETALTLTASNAEKKLLRSKLEGVDAKV